jgi:pimeloyl-ACP methyl ester carboxylesterase
MSLSVTDVPPLDNRRVQTSTEDVLVDRVVPGEILVIAFGFVSWETRPNFDFYGRLKKLEQASGRHINKVLVRDSGNAWYHRKIAGLGAHPDETAETLRALIAAIAPSKVITIGQSMGAYGALMYGLLLDVDSVIAFGPLSFLDIEQALLYHERRWLAVMRDLALNPPASGYYDLTTLPRGRAALHIIFGTKPDQANATESVNLDAMHAHRLAARGNCTLYPYPYSGHPVVQHLIDTKRINALLARLIAGIEIAEEGLEVSPDWLGWVAENLKLGGDPQELVAILQQHGFSHASAAAAVARGGAPV